MDLSTSSFWPRFYVTSVGFSANMAAVAALTMDGQVDIFSDALNHASLIDGCKLAARQGAKLHIFRHRDYNHLEDLLKQSISGRRKLVITDGVFSMDGDIADIQVGLLLHLAVYMSPDGPGKGIVRHTVDL
jgi:7-keto-8-aminopelargonate synthetase-like enzyme